MTSTFDKSEEEGGGKTPGGKKKGPPKRGGKKKKEPKGDKVGGTLSDGAGSNESNVSNAASDFEADEAPGSFTQGNDGGDLAKKGSFFSPGEQKELHDEQRQQRGSDNS